MKTDEFIYASETQTKSNAEIINETYFEYHGKEYDGYSIVEEYESRGVEVA